MFDTKKCSKCGTEYPATLEYFPRDSRRNNGLSSHCKNCARIYNRRSSLANYAKKKGMTLEQYYETLIEKFPYKKETYETKLEELRDRDLYEKRMQTIPTKGYIVNGVLI